MTKPFYQRVFKPAHSNLRVSALAVSALALSALPAVAQLNMICAPQIEWCQALSNAFEKKTGTKVSVTQKSTGEILAQVRAEKDNPKIDIWWGGTADGHIAAAENNLTEPYDVKSLDDLQPWARELYAITKKRTVGTGALVLGFGYNSELLAKKSLAPPACWDDLLKPQYKGEIQMANPNSSGTAYMVIATLVQMRGEDGAFNYLKALHGSVNSYTRSGVAPGKAAARGETGVAIGFLQDLAAEARAGFPVVTVAPCEGTGLNADGMSIVNGARNQENARAFFDWYLTPEAQAIGATVNQLHLPSNIKTPIPQGSPDPAKMSVIKFDYAKYGSSDERKRLLARWDKDIGSLPR